MLNKSLAALKSLLRNLGLLPWIGELVQRYMSRPGADIRPGTLRYLLRSAMERANYAAVEEVHDLPPIFHYWSNKYLLPKCQAFGFSNPYEFFANQLDEILREGGEPRFISIGSGNCDLEVRLAVTLRSRGHERFLIECLDLNETMLQRGQSLAIEQGVASHVIPRQGDFNNWQPDGSYGAVIASQSLHHVLALEHLFAACETAIAARGRFIIADMIGRNGHQRWPEARAIIDEFWRELPVEKRYNRLLRRHEEAFKDWDCSVSGFEGIRAQDILPLLVENFHFRVFLPFGNLIDPFTGRAFGGNFDTGSARDLDFIDRVHARDEAEMAAGSIKPTQCFAVVQNSRPGVIQELPGLSPAFCVRVPTPTS